MGTLRPQFHTYLDERVSEQIKTYASGHGIKLGDLVASMWAAYSGRDPRRLIERVRHLMGSSDASASLLVEVSKLGKLADEKLAKLRGEQ